VGWIGFLLLNREWPGDLLPQSEIAVIKIIDKRFKNDERHEKSFIIGTL
jgi:hypothetical protein